MAIEFKLPEVSEGVESADIAEIHIAEGDQIESEQVVMELETEKAVVELPCPHAGKVTKLHVAEGDTVEVGQTLLTIEETSDATKQADLEPGAPQAEAQTADVEEPETKTEEQPVAQRKGAEQEPAENAQEKEAEAQAAEQKPQARLAGVEEAEEAAIKPTGVERARASLTVSKAAATDDDEKPPPPAAPSTRRLARELGVDLHRVAGSGPGGRITTEDVQGYVRGLTQGAITDISAPMAAPELPDFNKFGPIERRRMNKLARTAAANLSISWQVIPHVTQHDLADITELEAARKRFASTKGRSRPKVTMTALLVKAVVGALKELPQFNSSLDAGAGELILKRYYHIGVAVDTEFGLLVPVIHDVDQKSILDVAAELSDLAERARARKLDLEEMQGATFTITNLGGIGGTTFTPIINFPEVAILGVSRIRKQLQMTDGAPQERLMLPLSLSYDHRVINGADAARFTVKLSQILSDYFQMLVEC